MALLLALLCMHSYITVKTACVSLTWAVLWVCSDNRFEQKSCFLYVTVEIHNKMIVYLFIAGHCKSMDSSRLYNKQYNTVHGVHGF